MKYVFLKSYRLYSVLTGSKYLIVQKSVFNVTLLIVDNIAYDKSMKDGRLKIECEGIWLFGIFKGI